MDPFKIVLPEDPKVLKLFYILVDERVNNIWTEYTTFVEAINLRPQTHLIFPILFSELDFYETLLMRIRDKLPKKILDEIKNDYFISDW